MARITFSEVTAAADPASFIEFELSEENVAQIVADIESHPELNTVSLDNSTLTPQEIDVLVDCFKTLPCKLTEYRPLTLEISECDFTPESFATFTRRLAECEKLAVLRLTRNHLSETDIHNLVAAIAALPHLYQLNISDEAVTQDCATAVDAVLLAGYSALRIVSLQGNGKDASASVSFALNAASAEIMRFNRDLMEVVQKLLVARTGILAGFQMATLGGETPPEGMTPENVLARMYQSAIGEVREVNRGNASLAARVDVAAVIIKSVATTAELPTSAEILAAKINTALMDFVAHPDANDVSTDSDSSSDDGRFDTAVPAIVDLLTAALVRGPGFEMAPYGVEMKRDGNDTIADDAAPEPEPKPEESFCCGCC